LLYARKWCAITSDAECTLTDTGNKPTPIPGGTEIPAKGHLILLTTIDLSSYAGGINSVSVKNGKVAGALQAADKTQQVTVAVFDTSTYALLGIANVGALPDRVTFSPDGKFIITAYEGEAKDDCSYDPVCSLLFIVLP
jgi:hypothetical protein